MSLDDIVQVSITVDTVTPSRVGFGIPLITCPFSGIYNDGNGEVVRTYTSLAGLVTDGFGTWHPVYKAAAGILAQNPKVTSFMVGREANADAQVVEITPTANLKDSYDYTIYINGVEITFTTTTATVKAIVEGLKAAIEASVVKFDGSNVLTDVLTPTEDDFKLTLTAKTADDVFTYYVVEREIMTSENTTTDNDISADLDAILAANNDWYYLTICNPSSDRIMSVAEYIETLVKFHVAASADDACYDSGSTTDVAYLMDDAGYARSALMFHPRANDLYAHARWAGRCAPYDPGSITWKFKTLTGLTTPTFTPTEVAALRAKTCNFYSTVAGVDISEEGYSSSGEFIDVTNGIDFLRARLQEYIFGMMAGAGKIPYTDAGVAMIENQIWAVLKLCIRQGILAESPQPTVTAPKVTDVSSTDKGNRLLPDVTFTATLAGAIHATEITGTVSV